VLRLKYIVNLASSKPNFVKSPLFIYITQVIFKLVRAPVGRSNVLHGLLEFAKLFRNV
jgi:hypothetical protein